MGEFQPGTHPRGGEWAPAGDPIPDYFPRVIEDALWKRVQVVRSHNFGRGKVPIGKYHGKGGRSNWKNLFLGIIYDNDGDTMVYKRVQDQWVYLVSSDRKKFRTHKTRYEPFKQAVLALLNLDWKLLLKDARPIKRRATNETEPRHRANS